MARADETPEAREARLARARAAAAQRRANETEEQRQARLLAQRERVARHRANKRVSNQLTLGETEPSSTEGSESEQSALGDSCAESVEGSDVDSCVDDVSGSVSNERRERRRLRAAERRANETDEQRQARLLANRERMARYRANQRAQGSNQDEAVSADQPVSSGAGSSDRDDGFRRPAVPPPPSAQSIQSRLERLSINREAAARRRAAETPQQRNARLSRDR